MFNRIELNLDIFRELTEASVTFILTKATGLFHNIAGQN